MPTNTIQLLWLNFSVTRRSAGCWWSWATDTTAWMTLRRRRRSSCCGTFAEEKGVKAGVLINGSRVALTGQGVAPSLFAVMASLGKERVVKRLRAAASIPTPHDVVREHRGRDDKFIGSERLNCRSLGFARDDKGHGSTLSLLHRLLDERLPQGSVALPCVIPLPQLACGKLREE